MSSAAHSGGRVWAQRGKQWIRLRDGGIFVDVVKALLPLAVLVDGMEQILPAPANPHIRLVYSLGA
jgi:hypothetical protein